MYYEITCAYTEIDQKGNQKEKKEKYITDVDFFAEAEHKALELFNNQCDVCDIKRSKVCEIINKKDVDEHFFRAKVVTLFVDENGNEKEQAYSMLVSAYDVKEATERTLEHLKQGMEDFRLEGIVRTKILALI